MRTLAGRGKLTEANMREGLDLVQQALLEADVSYAGRPGLHGPGRPAGRWARQVLKSLNPSQQIVGIVHQELVNLMGPVDHSLHLKPELTILMLCGLQGSGKTTTCGKLARLLKQRGKRADARGRRLAASRRPSTSCRCSASSWAFRCMPKPDARTRWPSARTPSSKPSSPGREVSFSIRPADCTSTKS